MSALVVHRSGARVSVESGSAVVRLGTVEIARRPLAEIGSVLIFGESELTTGARSELLRLGIDASYFTERGRFLGRLVGRESNLGERRRDQHRYLSDPDRHLTLARSFVAGKLHNQRQFLLRTRREHGDRVPIGAIAGLAALAARLPSCQSTDEVRGMEGLGARLYFQGLAAANLSSDLRFGGRSRRPPRDEVNACLSFGYTLLLREIESAIRATGLDLYQGALHDPGRGKPAAALDLMEEFRPVAVDRVVLRLVNRRQLTSDDFESAPSEAGEHGVYLNASGRPVLIQELFSAWRRRHVYTEAEGSLELRAIFRRQAERLAGVFEGKFAAFQSFITR